MVETRRQQIEHVASTLFRERGYAATSVRDIARALSLQGASIYAHVASKEDVLWSIVVGAADRFDAAVAPVADRTAPAADRLRDMVRAHVRVITDDLGNASSFLHEWRFLSPDRRAAVNARRDGYEARFRRMIADGIASGEFEATEDPRLPAMLILSALNGIATWYRPDGALTPGAIADRYADLFLLGLTGAAGPRRTSP